MNKIKAEIDYFRYFKVLIYIIAIIFIVSYLIDGFSFYSTAYSKRPRHEAYRLLRPAGDFGHGFGIIGSSMMLFMLLYSVRKRTRIFRNWGRLNRWLDIHIFFGIIGPLLIVLHTSFKVQGLVAVSFWSMVAVAGSGILGRYLYLQIPRSIRGDELSHEQINQALAEAESDDIVDFKIDEKIMIEIENDFLAKIAEGRGIISSVATSIIDDLTSFISKRRLYKKHLLKYGLSPEVTRKLGALARKRALLKRKSMLLNQIQQLFHYWHVFHKPFAIIMYIIMLVHVGVAVWLGYSWIF